MVKKIVNGFFERKLLVSQKIPRFRQKIGCIFFGIFERYLLVSKKKLNGIQKETKLFGLKVAFLLKNKAFLMNALKKRSKGLITKLSMVTNCRALPCQGIYNPLRLRLPLVATSA